MQSGINCTAKPVEMPILPMVWISWLKIRKLDERIRKLDQGEAEEPSADYEAYVPSKWYYSWDKISCNGKNCTCIAPAGVVSTWNHEEYPAYWQEG